MILTLGIKSSIYYPRRVLAQSFIQCFRILLLATVYSFVYQNIKIETPITVQMAVCSIAAYFCLLSIRFKNLFDAINDDIKLGNIEVMLNRPVNYLVYRIINQLGNDLFAFVVPVIFSFLLIPIIVGVPQIQLNILYVLGIIAVSLLGLLVVALLYAVIGFTAFWIEDARPVYWLVDKGVLLLGGSYLPIAFYPEWLKLFVYFTPFGSSMFVSHIFYPDFLEKLPMLLASQIFWIIVLIWLNSMVFKKAKTHLTINGG